MYKPWESALAALLTYVPYVYLFVLAFRKDSRFSHLTTHIIAVLSVVIRVAGVVIAKMISPQAVYIFNYAEVVLLFVTAILITKNSAGRILFIGLMLKNTRDTVVIIAKFLEHLVWPRYAQMGYHWTYSVFLLIVSAIILPPVRYIIKKYFTKEIRRSISRRWSYLFVVPLFFYITWIYVFYLSSDATDLELAFEPVNSLFLICSLGCQYIIYMCIASLVESAQKEARLEEENHAMRLQNVQYSYIHQLIDDDVKLRHDLRHHFNTISSLVEEKNYEKLEEYVKRYITPALWHSQIRYCSNTVLNIMASYTRNKCTGKHIDCQIALEIPEKLPLSDTDITVLFGNLLENAFEAANDVTETDNRKVMFLGKVINNNLLFQIENYYENEIKRTKSGIFCSTKHPGKGNGTRSAVEIAKKYGADIDFSYEHNIFTVNILFPDISCTGQ